MKIEKIKENERSCRNCARFNATQNCWKSKKECGEGLPKFRKRT